MDLFKEKHTSQRAGHNRGQMLQSLLWFLNSTRVCVLIKYFFLTKEPSYEIWKV